MFQNLTAKRVWFVRIKWCLVLPISLVGFEILAFPCNQFAGQEPGSNEEIQEVVCTRFKAEFPIFDKVILIIEGKYKSFLKLHMNDYASIL